MCAWTCTCVCMHACRCARARVRACTRADVHAWLEGEAFACLDCRTKCLHTCLYTRLCTCMCAYVYAHVCTHVDTHVTGRWSSLALMPKDGLDPSTTRSNVPDVQTTSNTTLCRGNGWRLGVGCGRCGT